MRTRLHFEKLWSKSGLWIFLLSGDKHKMDRSPSKNKQTNKQRRQNSAIDVVTSLEDSIAERSWFDSREAQEIYLIFNPLYWLWGPPNLLFDGAADYFTLG